MAMTLDQKTLLSNITTRFPYFYLYAILLCAIVAYALVSYPIKAHDFDLWYHLNGGKYIVENGTLANTSFFSFFSPPKERVPYSWLFRLLIYRIYQACGYTGIIVLRGICYLAMIALIAHYLLGQQKNNVYGVVFFTLLAMFLVMRYKVIRPHLASYFFVTLSIYILELYPRKAFYLPIIAVLWSNMHGITYPLLLLLVLAYGSELLLCFFSKKRLTCEQSFLGALLVLTALCVLVTPYGNKLLAVPFISTQHAVHYIDELKPLKWQQLLSLQFTTLIPSSLTIFNIIFAATTLTTCYRRCGSRLCHVIMFGGGCYLLATSVRFQYEFILFSLPLIKSHITDIGKLNLLKNPYKNIILLPMLIIASIYFFRVLPTNLKFPLCKQRLPLGVTNFLNHIDTGGNLLHHPTNGGYFQWALSSKYKIAMDMQVPHLFSDEDFFLTHKAFVDEEILTKLLRSYSIDFISISRKNKTCRHFPAIGFSYTPVFFDDFEVLYVNHKLHPQIANKYALHSIDPYELDNLAIAQLSTARQQALLRELLKIAAIYPCRVVNLALAALYQSQKSYEQALIYADAAIADSPESTDGYRAKGNVLALQNRVQLASVYFQKAISLTAGQIAKEQLYRKLAGCYWQLGQYDNAYRAFCLGIKLYKATASYKELYLFALSAQKSGRKRESLKLLRFAYFKTPDSESKWQQRIIQKIQAYNVY